MPRGPPDMGPLLGAPFWRISEVMSVVGGVGSGRGEKRRLKSALATIRWGERSARRVSKRPGRG